MDKQILFNFILKKNIYEIGTQSPVCIQLVDLNGMIIPEDFINEFKKITVLEHNFRTIGDTYTWA